VDGWRRVIVDDYDYRGLAGVGDDVISLDWDTAVGDEDLRLFAGQAAASPGDVLVAPVRTYYGPKAGQWNLADADGNILGTGTPRAQVFGFGMVYLPARLLAAYTGQQPGVKLTDMWFASWHLDRVDPRGAAVCWAVRPVHLHYPAAISGTIREDVTSNAA